MTFNDDSEATWKIFVFCKDTKSFIPTMIDNYKNNECILTRGQKSDLLLR